YSDFYHSFVVFFFQAEDRIRDGHVTGFQTCALPIYRSRAAAPELVQQLGFDLVLVASRARRLHRAPVRAGGDARRAPHHRELVRDRKSVVEGKSVYLERYGFRYNRLGLCSCSSSTSA